MRVGLGQRVVFTVGALLVYCAGHLFGHVEAGISRAVADPSLDVLK